jgi:hypothetical protein
LNRWFDELPRERRFWTTVGALGVVCIINLPLAGSVGIPLALLFALELLALILIRAPYISGMVESPSRRLAPREMRQLAAETVPPLNIAAPATVAEAHAADA